MHASPYAGHTGFFKTRTCIRELYWWPAMDQDIEKACNQCITCNRTSNKYNLRRQPAVDRDLPDGPNHRVHVDLFGPLQARTDTGKTKKYVMVMTDAFTKMAVLRVLPNKLAATTAKMFLEAWVYTFGVPRTVITDQGNEFKGDFDYTLRVLLQSKHITTTPYHPQSNGQVEVFNRTLAHYLRTMIEDCQVDTLEWEAYIMPLQFAYNTAIHRITMTTPFFAQFGYDPMVPLWKRKDRAMLDQTQRFHDPVSRVLHVNHRVHDIIRARLPGERKKQDIQYNKKHHTQRHEFHIGDRVWVERICISQANPKLTQKWEEALVTKVTSHNTLTVSRYQRSKHREITIHVDKVRPMVSATPPDSSHDTTTDKVDEIDPRDLPTLTRLYQGVASQDDIHTLMSKGYVIVFPNGMIQPTAAPTPGPRMPAPHQPLQQIQDMDDETDDEGSMTYVWQRQKAIRQPTAQYPIIKPVAEPSPKGRQTEDRLTRLAKQLQIPPTSSFLPAPTLPGLNLREKPHRTLNTINKMGDRILAVPKQLKEAYIRSGQSELTRLNEAALEIFYRNQRRQEEKRHQQKIIQDRVRSHFDVYSNNTTPPEHQ